MAPNRTFNNSASIPDQRFVPDDSWRMLLEADQASEDFLRLTINTLNAQRRNTLDVSQFTEEEATQLIRLIDTNVRDLRNRVRTVKNSTICRCFDMETFRAG